MSDVDLLAKVSFPFEAVKETPHVRPMRVIRTDEPQTLWPVYHAGEHGCGNVAFFSTRRWVANVDVITAEEAVCVDGSAPQQHTEIMCGSCGKQIWFNAGELEYADGE